MRDTDSTDSLSLFPRAGNSKTTGQSFSGRGDIFKGDMRNGFYIQNMLIEEEVVADRITIFEGYLDRRVKGEWSC